MPPWSAEQMLILLAVCVFLIGVLPKLGPSEKPPLDTTHDLHDLPEWYPLSSIGNESRDK